VAERVSDQEKGTMSRYYEMTVTVSGHDPAKESQIRSAAAEEWPFEDWREQGEGQLCSSAQDNLCGGLSEEVFAERLSLAIWKANGAYCEVVVNATYLEELPHERHALGEDDYARLIAAEGDKDEKDS
jgi:hypothetical protein